ncbi:MAG: helix-turn-helix domain-containing protein, partial [Vicinamibacterales bacterium]
HACAVATGSIIGLEDLPEALRGYRAAVSPGRQRPLIERERVYVRAVLDRVGGNRQRAAEELGISLSTLKRRLRRPGSSTR